MTKPELINAIQDRMTHEHGRAVNKSDVEALLESLHHTAVERLSSGKELALPGIGKLFTKHREGRTGRNPQTGEALFIPARVVVDFSVAGPLKAQLNQ